VSIWGGFLTNKLMKKYPKIFKNVVAALLGVAKSGLANR